MESSFVKIQSASKITVVIAAFLGLTVFTQYADAQPPNDECVSAIEVFDGVTPYDNIDAGDSAPEWLCAAGGSDVWFEYTATCSGDAIFETCNDGALPETDYDSAIQVFNADSCGNLDDATSGCNDDNCGLQSSVTLPVHIGETYLIRVGGFAGAQGVGHLEIIPPKQCFTQNIPTLSEWGLTAMAGILGIVGFIVIRRRKVAA